MVKHRTIYIDEETKEIEEKILKKDPQFNFSHLYKQAILGSHEQGLKGLKKSIEQDELQLEILKKSIKQQKEELEELEQELEQKETEQKETKAREESLYKQRVKQFIENCKDYYGLNKEKAEELIEEFIEAFYIKKTVPSLYEFMELKGIKEKK